MDEEDAAVQRYLLSSDHEIALMHRLREARAVMDKIKAIPFIRDEAVRIAEARVATLEAELDDLVSRKRPR